ncbi:MAG: hypothetical protein Q4D38_05210, partial [Planctomycetia bacterium]|nr:hypothetical protein [Planctomycetia bacterium]
MQRNPFERCRFRGILGVSAETFVSAPRRVGRVRPRVAFFPLFCFFCAVFLLFLTTNFSAHGQTLGNSPAGTSPSYLSAPTTPTAPSMPTTRPTPAQPGRLVPSTRRPTTPAPTTTTPPPATNPLNSSNRSTTVVPAVPPGKSSAWDTRDLILGPQNVVARPGSEVILTAGVRDQTGYLRTNQRIVWGISADSVGHFSKIADRDITNVFVGDFVTPRIESDTRAVGTTLRSQRRLDRGTPDPKDDIIVRPGETWISVSSPREGISYVTAAAPDIEDWKNKQQTARIVWIDAEVKFPPSRVVDFGGRVTLNTILRRCSDTRPLANWRVRYEICGNTNAVFADGNKMLEVLTNAAGEAKIDLQQSISRQEDTVVAIQIIRPAEPGTTFTQPVVVQESRVRYRWAPNTIMISKSMAREAYIGSVVPATILVTNLSNDILENIRVTDIPQEGLKLAGAIPESDEAVDGAQWIIRSLMPHESYSIQLNYRVERPGTYLTASRVQIEKLGNALVVEATAELSAGSETSPYTPPPTQPLRADESGESGGSGGSGESGGANNAPTTFSAAPSAVAPSPTTDASGTGPTGPLPPPAMETEAPVAPAAPTSPTSPATPSSTPPATPPTTPAQPSPAGEVQRALAPVLPLESPDVLVSLDISAFARVELGEVFNVYLGVYNRSGVEQPNVGVRVESTKGVVNVKSAEENPYLAQKSIGSLSPGVRRRFLCTFRATMPGEQTISVRVFLPNGVSYSRMVRLDVHDPNTPPGVTPIAPAPVQPAPIPPAPAPSTPADPAAP